MRRGGVYGDGSAALPAQCVELEAILRSFELGTRGTILEVALEFKVR